MQYTYSDTFAHTITRTYGAQGIQWLTQIPTRIEQCAAQWNLTELNPYPHLTYNYVLSGMMNTTPIVLKLRCTQESLEKECAALNAYHGYDVAQLLAYNINLGAMLLERAIPGKQLTSLFSQNDSDATRVAAERIRILHQAPIPSSYKFRSLETLLPTFTDEHKLIAPFIAHARTLRKKLLTADHTQIFLHGDFHQGNIISSGDQWIVIDPQAAIGNPLYDLAVYIRNPLIDLIQTSHAQKLITNRINDFATILGYDAQQIKDWTYLQAIASAYWLINDGLGASPEAFHHATFLEILLTIDV